MFVERVEKSNAGPKFAYWFIISSSPEGLTFREIGSFNVVIPLHTDMRNEAMA